MRLLLFSNSRNEGEEYLSYTLPYIKSFLKFEHLTKALFIPYAGISIRFDNYLNRVKEKLSSIELDITSLHNQKDKIKAVNEAQIIIIGGGNTFCLLKTIQEQKLLSVIKEKVIMGTPYIGWSAGANLACPSIKTTNDMPIVEPENFTALQLIPFQINPHYTDFIPPGHAGETREMRIEEFILMNKEIYVAGLREGTLFQLDGNKIILLGNKPCRIFRHEKDPVEKYPGEDFSFLI
jgi:dipeptidase E